MCSLSAAIIRGFGSSCPSNYSKTSQSYLMSYYMFRPQSGHQVPEHKCTEIYTVMQGKNCVSMSKIIESIKLCRTKIFLSLLILSSSNRSMAMAKEKLLNLVSFYCQRTENCLEFVEKTRSIATFCVKTRENHSYLNYFSFEVASL